MIRATTPGSTKVKIPFGSAIYLGGWDGSVSCEEERAYVPQGISLWEFSTSANYKGKADENYKKRREDPLGHDPNDSVFIFVTPRLWTEKDVWVKAKKAENYWKDVMVYDVLDIVQWLDNTLSVSRWFAAEPGVRAYPFDGIMTVEEFWEEWSAGPKNLVLLPESILSGREYEKDLFLKILMILKISVDIMTT